jgi:hypothetical protein
MRRNPYTNGSVRARLVLGVAVMALLAACGGETQVGGGGIETRPTAPTATGPTATGPTAETATEAFGGPVQLDLSQRQNPTGAAFYSCDGLEGTWTYEPGELPVEGVEITMRAEPVDMDGGDGTLVIEGEITLPAGAGSGTFTDTVELEIVGTDDAPAIHSTGVEVDATGIVEGFGFDIGQFFPENVEIPIVEGAPQC